MSDYSEYSVSPLPRHRKHHIHQHQSKERSPPPSPSPNPNQRSQKNIFSVIPPYKLETLYVFVWAIIIQLFLPDSDISIQLPSSHAQPMAHQVNEWFWMIPKLDCLLEFTKYPYEIVVISIIIASIYRCLQYTGQNSILSFIVSTYIIFDETTYSLMLKNPSFALQIELMLLIMEIPHKFLTNDKFSVTGISSILDGIFFIILLLYLRIESLPIIFIYLVSLAYNNQFSSNSRHYVIEFLTVIGRSIFLILSIVFYVSLILLVVIFFKFPRFQTMKNQSKIVIFEFYLGEHNVAFLLLPVFALLFTFSFKKPGFLMISYFACILFTMYLPFTSFVDDMKIKVANMELYSIIWFGQALVTPDAGIVRKSLILLTWLCLIYFYVYPIRV